MLEFLAVVALIAIAFGVSLQSAFWGIIAFVVGVIGVCIVLTFVDVGVSVIASRIRYNQTLAAKQAKQIKAAKRKQAIKNGAIEGLAMLTVASPLLVGALLALTCPDFTDKYPIQTFMIAALPLIFGAVALIATVRRHKR